MPAKRAKPPRLSPEEKAERDARATHWMNQRKIERVWEACRRARIERFAERQTAASFKLERDQ